MDLTTMKYTNSNWQITDLVEGWESLIWTERYSDGGEFVLTTPDIDKTRALLPLDQLVVNPDSKNVMMVDTHLIEEDDEGKRTLKVMGVGFEAFCLKERTHLTSNDASFAGVGTVAQVLTSVINKRVGWLADDEGRPYDMIPKMMCTAAGITGDVADYSEPWVEEEPASLWDWAKGHMDPNELGIRAEKPDTSVYPYDHIILRILQGKDMSGSVKLSHEEGHLVSPSYLFTRKDTKTIAYVVSPIGALRVGIAGTPPGNNGLAVRNMQVDGNDMKAKSGVSNSTQLTRRGRKELREHRKTTILDSQASVKIPYIFQTHYDLGDLILVKGDYGVNQKMRVTEYTRVQDAEGERAYPSLSSDI